MRNLNILGYTVCSRQVENWSWWKMFGGKVWWKNVVGIFGGNDIFDILEPPAFQKYKIHWVLEPLSLSVSVTCVSLSFCESDLINHHLFLRASWEFN